MLQSWNGPKMGKILIKSLAEGNELYPNKISKVELLGYGKSTFLTYR